MTPVDTIIQHFEEMAKIADEAHTNFRTEAVKQPESPAEYMAARYAGKAEGIRECAQFLKDLQTLFS